MTWQTTNEVEKARCIDTAIRKLDDEEIALLTKHGYEIASFFLLNKKSERLCLIIKIV